MNYFSISNLAIVVINLPVAILLFLSSQGRKANIVLGYLCLVAAVWGFGSYKYSVAVTTESALFWWQIANVGSIFSTVTFFCFIRAFLNIKKRLLLFCVFGVTVFFLYLNFFVEEVFIGELEFIFNEFYYIYWPKTKSIYYLVYYFIFYVLLLFYSFLLLLKEFVRAVGVRRQQMKYLIVGMVSGFIGCHACFIPVFGFKIYPYLNILIAFYTLPIGYAIIRYRFMDIKLVVTRVGIFLCIYTLVLGIPFWVGLKSLGFGIWLVPVSVMAVLATVGPFIYLFIQKKAENQLLAEQHAYQATLRRASLGMGRVKDLRRLLNLIVYIVTKTVKITHCEIYLFHRDSNQYILKASKSKVYTPEPNSILGIDSPLIKYLSRGKESIIYEEISQRSQDFTDKNLKEVEQEIKKLDGALVVPTFIEEKLLAVIILEKRKMKKCLLKMTLLFFLSLPIKRRWPSRMLSFMKI